MNIKVTAEVYRLGIMIGFYTVPDVIKWADHVLHRKSPLMSVRN